MAILEYLLWYLDTGTLWNIRYNKMKNFIIEMLMYIIIGIVLLAGVTYLNRYVNTIKKEKCNNISGVFVLNTSDANMSTCILK